ncbi:thioredoxin family protein [Persicirhabdus sediminis]|nr:thioredoxin family protein [Persicirhabdus sediminis]
MAIKRMVGCLILGAGALAVPLSAEQAQAESGAGKADAVAATAADGAWQTNLEKAQQLAKDENKALLVLFTGSDWCPPCMMMDEKVFSKAEFAEQASEQFVLLKLDMPREDPQNIGEVNEKLMMKYKVTAVPTVLLLDAEGKEFKRFSAGEYPDIKGFVEYIGRQYRRKDME